MDREAWCAAVHGVTRSWAWLSDWTELNWIIDSQCCVSFRYTGSDLVIHTYVSEGFPYGSVVKNLSAMQETWVQSLGWEDPWRREWQPCQYSGMENSMDRGVWQAIVHLFSAVQSLCCVWLFVTPWTAASQASLFITNSQSLLKLMSIELVMPSNRLILCYPLLLLPAILPSIRVFSSESVLHIRWPKYWSFSFSISPFNDDSGLISFRIDWFNLLAVQENLKSLLQHQSSKASILQHSAFFRVQLSHPYMTTGKTIALTRWTFVGKVMSLLFNMLPRLVIAFLPRSKCLLISWLQSPSAVILEPPKMKSFTVFIISPSICHEVMWLDAMILVFWMQALSQLFHSPLSLSSRGSFLILHFLP